MAPSDILVTVLAAAVWLLLAALHYGLLAFSYLLANYPQASSFLSGLVLLYVAYKLVARLVRFWYGMVVAAVKTAFFVSLVVLCVAVYLRGWKFVSHDLPFLRDTLTEFVADSDTAKPKYLRMLLERLQGMLLGQVFSGKKSSGHQSHGSRKYTNDYGIDIDESYFDYINDNFQDQDFDYDKIKDFVAENIGNVDHFLRDQGIDLEQLGQNIAHQFGR